MIIMIIKWCTNQSVRLLTGSEAPWCVSGLSGTCLLTIIRRSRSVHYTTISTQPKENNCFIRTTTFSLILLVSS